MPSERSPKTFGGLDASITLFCDEKRSALLYLHTGETVITTITEPIDRKIKIPAPPPMRLPARLSSGKKETVSFIKEAAESKVPSL